MSYLWTFISGIVTGVFIEQNYKTPNVKKLLNYGLDKLKDMEKENSKKKE